MSLIILVSYVTAIFLTLWLADLYFTVKTVSKLGAGVELNPIMRSVLSFRGRFIWLFKAVELVVFGYLIYYAGVRDGEYVLGILYLLILFHTFVVAQGISVYSQLYKTNKPGIILFVLMSLFALFFINSNFNFYADNITLAKSINSCNDEYAKVYTECRGEAAPKEFRREFDLNLPLPR